MNTPTVTCTLQYWRNESRSRTHRDWHRAYTHANWTTNPIPPQEST